jgi:S1-C subfamily serine protease
MARTNKLRRPSLAVTLLIPLIAAVSLTAAPSRSGDDPAFSGRGSIDLQKLNQESRNAVVKIEFTEIRNLRETKLNPRKSERYSGSDDEGAHGSGFFISDTEILTNAHVVEDARRGSIVIKSPATGNMKFKVQVVGVGGSGSIDLAVLQLPKDEQVRFLKHSGLAKVPFLKLGDSGQLKQSDALAILGYPTDSDEMKIIQAEMTGRQYQKFSSQHFWIKHQFIEVGPGGVVQPGNSGGPALDKKGVVVGIPTLGDWNGNQGWLIPISLAKEFLDRIRKDQVGRVALDIPELGIELARNFAGTLVWAGAPEDLVIFELGVVAREVFPLSMAEKWGIRNGDILVGFANKQKGISCALDFEGYRVVTGAMTAWPKIGRGTDNLGKPKLHLGEMVYTSNVGDEVTLWFVRPAAGAAPGTVAPIQSITRTVEISKEHRLPPVGLYDKPDYEYWGDFVVQDFNAYNSRALGVPIVEILNGGVPVTYVEPNSLASHRGLELSSSGYGGFFGHDDEEGGSGSGTWYIADSVNGASVRTLAEFRAALRAAEKTFDARQKAPDYDASRKNLCRERYVQIGVRTPSSDGKLVRFTAAFPIDEALECCR